MRFAAAVRGVDDRAMRTAQGLIEPIDLTLPRLPVSLNRLRIAHLTDLHMLRRTAPLDGLIDRLVTHRLDLGVLTGDYMERRTDPAACLAYLGELTRRVRPRLGWFGVFGNHDSDALIQACHQLDVTWLVDHAVCLPNAPIELLGMRCTPLQRVPDAIKLAEAVADLPACSEADPSPRLRLALSHRPDMLRLAADLGSDLMLSGHTHGGQVRLPTGRVLMNGCDLPRRVTSGIFEHRGMHAAISRGLGSVGLFGSSLRIRLFCPPQLPIYTLRCGPVSSPSSERIRKICHW